MTAKILIPVLLFALAPRVLGQELPLSIQAPTKAIQVGDYPKFIVTIRNQGETPRMLVLPGDGSECKWRTPVIGWSVLSAESPEQKHPQAPPLSRGARCGDINAIKLIEVFILQPGESRQLGEWIGHPGFVEPGKFRVVFYYENIPTLKVSGIPLGNHETGVLQKIKQSYACRLISNEIIVDVLPKKNPGFPEVVK